MNGGPFPYERYLTPVPEQADALVDLSDVVRDARLGRHGARSLDRLRLVIEALGDRLRDQWVTVHAIADPRLRTRRTEFPDRTEPDLLARLIRDGLVAELPDAREALLDIAGMTGLPVIGRDSYDDLRGGHPWVQGNTAQFLMPRPAPARTVRLTARDMGVHAADRAPRPRRPLVDVVARHWRCPERTCSLYDRRRGEAVQLPRVRGGEPQCEWHGLPLADDGPRPGVAGLRLRCGPDAVHRLALDAGTTVVLGRAPGPALDGERTIAIDRCIADGGSPPDAGGRRVSRRHLEIRVGADALRLRNLSRHGTRLWRPGPGAGTWSALPDDRPAVLHTRDIAELAPGVTLARTGRRLPAEIAAAWREAAAEAERRGGGGALTGPPP
ncbi:FHA domain-containing protein [Streptomyces sp. RFCAC02]|uniref:FHA domain-containing protein n=1 Tax=Streptomyces sp. RFCAC02 TaxID=2499143 RepID=UPI00101EAC19|nr:FHA domain-containing protein [Streptomyces sp. RFCAC02]